MSQPSAITRRTTLTGLSAAAAAASFPALAQAPQGKGEVFRHGVASGDPDVTSVVLWTRVTVPAALEVEWELASDPRFQARAMPRRVGLRLRLGQALMRAGWWLMRAKAGEKPQAG